MDWVGHCKCVSLCQRCVRFSTKTSQSEPLENLQVDALISHRHPSCHVRKQQCNCEHEYVTLYMDQTNYNDTYLLDFVIISFNKEELQQQQQPNKIK